jgi:hypothetical protein
MVADLPIASQPDAFARRYAGAGFFYSVCLRCHLTAASAQTEYELLVIEALHSCSRTVPIHVQ